MFKKLSIALALGGATLVSAMAQTPPANPNAPANPAIATPAPSAAAPSPGANSFTEMQAKERLEAEGFSAVQGLMKDKDGIWRGMATKAGRTLTVGVDYKGNVVEN